MIRALSIVAALLLTGTAVAQTPGDAVGDWHGTLATPAGELVVIITITSGSGGVLEGVMEVPTQAPGRRIPLANVVAAADSIAFAVPAIGASYRGRWQRAGGHWAGTFSQGMELPLRLDPGRPPAAPVVPGIDGRWEATLLRNDAGLRLILWVRTGEHGTVANLDSPDMGAMNLPVAGLARHGDTVRFGVPAATVEYLGVLSNGQRTIRGMWSRPGQLAATVIFTRVDSSASRAARPRPQTPREPITYYVEDVTFDNPEAPGVRLAGTLTTPSNHSGPHAAAVLISGSGPQDRDEALFDHKPFAVLADHLTKHGIAVLRYDDRGFAESTGNHDRATSADFATDAVAAVRYLQSRPDIEPDKVGLIGHSEGGMIGPLAAVDHPDIAFLVLLAGPGTGTVELMETQARLMGQAQGVSDAELARRAPVVRSIHAALRRTASREEAERAVDALLTPDALAALGATSDQRAFVIHQYTRDWYRYFLRYDPATVLRRVTVPVLAINGSLDQQVPAAPNLAGIEAALAHNPDVTVRELPGLNHLFQTARTGSIGEYRDISETFAPVALTAISEWIAARFVHPGG